MIHCNGIGHKNQFRSISETFVNVLKTIIYSCNTMI